MSHFGLLFVLVVSMMLTGSSSPAIAQGVSVARPSCPQADVQPVMNVTQRQRLIALLDQRGIRETLDAKASAALCVDYSGRHVPVKQIGSSAGKIVRTFGRFDTGAGEFYFTIDPEAGNASVGTYVFKTDAQFRLLGQAVLMRDGQITYETPEFTARMYNRQMLDWIRILDLPK